MTAHELHHLFFDEIRICGCGDPESVGVLVRDILMLAPFYDSQDRLQKLLPSNGIFYLVLGVLDHARLLEHGGGIGGSWLTDRGRDVLESLRRESIQAVFDDDGDDSCILCNQQESI